MNSELSFSVLVKAGQSVLHRCFYSPPLKLLTLGASQPLWPHALLAMQMSSSPGLLGGDGQNIHIELETHAALHLKTQSYQRVLSMNSECFAEQTMHVVMNECTRLCYMPHALVLHAGTSLKQKTHIQLSDNAELVWGEIFASGRRLNGEHFAFERLSSQTRIDHHQRPILFDNIQWQPKQQYLGAIGQMEGFSHQLNWYYVHTGVCDIKSRLEQVQHVLETYEPTQSGVVLVGASVAALGALQVRALGHSAEVLEDLQQRLALLMV